MVLVDSRQEYPPRASSTILEDGVVTCPVDAPELKNSIQRGHSSDNEGGVS